MERLEQEIKIVETDERLHVVPHGKSYQYYRRKNAKDVNGTYIRKGQRNIAIQLAQNEYNKVVLNKIRRELVQLRKLQKFYGKVGTPETYFEKLSRGRQLLITPLEESDEIFLEKWKSVKYEKMGFHEDSLYYVSSHGEKMRSKSEVIIASILDKLEIPYYYEKPLFLKGKGWVRPDFTMLRMSDRQEVYFEHFGMMDDEEYCNNALKKIRYYESNGYYLGQSLLITGETSSNPIDIGLVEEKIKAILRLKA